MKKTLGWVLFPTNRPELTTTAGDAFAKWLEKTTVYPTREKARRAQWSANTRVGKLVILKDE